MPLLKCRILHFYDSKHERKSRFDIMTLDPAKEDGTLVSHDDDGLLKYSVVGLNNP